MGLFNWLFRRMCYRIFKTVDRDGSGLIEDIEIEIAIYRLYNLINKRIPGWQDPPERREIIASMRVYDTDGDLKLNRDEFVNFARALVKNGPDMFFARVGRHAAYETAALPIAARGLQMGLSTAGMPGVNNMPLHLAAPAVGIIFKAIRAVLPIGL